MVDIKKLKQDVIDGLNEDNERAIKDAIRCIIRDIISQQENINQALKIIAERKITLKNLEAKPEIKASEF